MVLPPSMPASLPVVLLLFASFWARCGGGSPVSVEPLAEAADTRAPGTENYLKEAVLPGSLFRWTPSPGSTVIDLPIEVHDGTEDLPARLLADGMDPAEIERQVREVVAVWADAAAAAGVDVQPEFAFRSQGQSFAGDARSRIHVRFLSPLGGAFEGQASLLVDAASPDRVLSAEIEIRVPVLVESIPLDGYRALLAHEFGHAFGIISEAPASGHSPDGNDVMYPIAQWSTLSAGDRAAMTELYRTAPDLTRADDQRLQSGGDVASERHFSCRP